MKLCVRSILLVLGASALPAAAAVDFARDVKPIFDRSCAACHGEKQQLGQLRLDARKIVLEGGLSGKTVVPGKPDESELYRRVAGVGDQPRMPMGGELPAAEVATIRQWIEEGAVWPEEVGTQAEVKKHWAFLPPVRPAMPKVRNQTWVKNPIDAFILARLEKEGLSPAQAADRTTLLRRAHFDITGLPPTIEEADAFLADSRPEAFARLVDRLLDSPHYGERWARHWLDAARYADSDGFEKDKPRNVWFYRDWVLDALNRDLGYDQFVIEQIAGDLLPNATQAQHVATGFLRNSMINEEGGIDPEQFRMEAMFDRMDAVGKAILGLTIQCAQCHNHKFDPLTQEEYYRIFAFLNNSHEANVAVYTAEQQAKRAEIFREMRMIEDEMMHRTPDWRERMAKWEREVRAKQPDWTVVEAKMLEGVSGEKYLYPGDGSILAQGYAPTNHTVVLTAETDARDIRAIRMELLNDPNLPQGGPGRSTLGVAVLSELSVEIAPKSAPEKKTQLEIVWAEADVNPAEKELDSKIFPTKDNKRRITGGIEFAIDGCEETGWTTDNGPGRRNEPRTAIFRLREPAGFEGGSILKFYLVTKHGGWNSDDNQNQNMGRWRFSITSSERADETLIPQRLHEIFAIPAAERTPEQQRAVFAYWRTRIAGWEKENARIEELWRAHPEGSSQLVMMEREQPRMTHRLDRGDFLKPKEEVGAGVPRFLNAMHAEGEPDRLDFARWLTARDHPTTARTMVNRIWQSYFGTGLVETAEDLGTQAPPPSHPELLDWLAVELMESNWSLKHLHRLIATSNAYQQSSHVTPELLEKDPKNRLLSRGPRFRVEGEIVRDVALAASGLLTKEIGGPPVHPPAPDFLFQPPVSYGPKRWDTETDAQRYRRALYTFRFRSVPYPALDAFDTPNGDAACVRRVRSNTPMQALTTLNETVFLEAAKALASQALAEGGPKADDRLTYAFRRVLTRPPNAAEKDALLSMLDRQHKRFASGELSAKDFVGEASPELAAWTTVTRVLLNLDEAITKE